MKNLDNFINKLLIEGPAGQAAFQKMGQTSQATAFEKREQQLAGTGGKARAYNIEQVKSYIAKLKELNTPKNLVLQAINEVYATAPAAAPAEQQASAAPAQAATK